MQNLIRKPILPLKIPVSIEITKNTTNAPMSPCRKSLTNDISRCRLCTCSPMPLVDCQWKLILLTLPTDRQWQDIGPNYGSNNTFSLSLNFSPLFLSFIYPKLFKKKPRRHFPAAVRSLCTPTLHQVGFFPRRHDVERLKVPDTKVDWGGHQ